MKILHVTESFASGVLSFIEDLSGSQVDQGAEPHVLYVVRPDTPDRAQIEARFSPRVVLHPPIEAGFQPRVLLRLAIQVRRLVREHQYDAVHAHSSHAGAVVRLALMTSPVRVFYSPHGFAFLRLNTSRVSRWLTRLAEKKLARLGSLVLTSQSEIDIACTTLSADRVYYLRSGVAASSVQPRPRVDRARPRVIMVARMVYQKAPWRFAEVASRLGEHADFVWVGGDKQGTRRWMGDAPVQVIEWVTSSELEELISSADVLLFPTLWEGFSLSLVQAQAAGLPAVTTDVVGNRDAVRHGVTGFVCRDQDQVVEAVRRLILDPELRWSMGEAAQRWVKREFISDYMGADTLAIYDGRAPRAMARGRS